MTGGQLPNLLILGAPKCGTTALFDYLAAHPAVFPCAKKEPHYFCRAADGWPPWGEAKLDDYAALFAGGEGYAARVEASTWSLYSRGAAALMRQVVPDARFVAMLRHPVDRAYSSYLYRVRFGLEDAPTFADAVAREPARIAAGAEWDYHYLAAGRYAAQLRRYLDRFPRDRVRVVLYEDYRDRPSETAAAVLAGLGLAPAGPADPATRANVTAGVRNREFNRLLARPGRLKAAVKAILPSNVRVALIGRLRDWNAAPAPRIDSGLRTELTKVVAEDIRETADLIGRDLSAWLPPEAST